MSLADFVRATAEKLRTCKSQAEVRRARSSAPAGFHEETERGLAEAQEAHCHAQQLAAAVIAIRPELYFELPEDAQREVSQEFTNDCTHRVIGWALTQNDLSARRIRNLLQLNANVVREMPPETIAAICMSLRDSPAQAARLLIGPRKGFALFGLSLDPAGCPDKNH